MVSPIDTSDGAQAAVGGSFRPSGFAPTPDADTKTNVAAPLDVRGAPSQASLLANQLQNSLQTLRWPLMRAEQAHGEEQAQQQYQQGTADVLAGSVNDDTMQKDANYRAGVVRVHAQRAALVAATGWQQFAADPKNNVAGMSPTQVLQAADDYFRKNLGGLETDPIAATAISPIVQHVANETLGRFTQYRHQQNLDDGLTTAVQLAQAQAQHGGNLFDYEQQLGTLTALAVGAGGSRADAKQALDKGLIQAAVANHSPALLDMIKAAPGQKGLAPATQLAVSDARDGITHYNAEQTAQATQQRQSSVLAGWDTSLFNKTPIPDAAIKEAMGNGDITPQAGLMYQQKSKELQEHMQATTAATNAANSGQPLYTLVGTQIPGAKPGKLYTQEILQKSFDANIDQLPQGQRIAAAVRATQQQGYTYSPLVSTANNEPVNSAQGVKDVTGLYSGLNSVDASITGKYFNPKRLAEVRQLVQMKEGGMSDADIATWVEKHGAPQTPEAIGSKALAINAALSNWTVSGPRAHWYTPGTSSNLPVLSGATNPGQIVNRVKARAAFLAQSGLCTPDVCVSEAARQIQDESYTIDVGNGHSMVVPMTKSDPPKGLAQPALQWFYDSQAANVAKAGGYEGDPSMLKLVPNVAQPGTYELMTPTGLPASRDTFSLAGIVNAWQKSVANDAATWQAGAAGRMAAQQQQERQSLGESYLVK